MGEPAITLSLWGIVSPMVVAQRLFERLFPERALDLRVVASDRNVGAREVIWLGAEGTGVRIEREWSLQQTRDDEISVSRDVVHEAGTRVEARWFRIDHEFNGIRVEVGLEGASLEDLAVLRDEIVRAGVGTSETVYLALQVVRALPGLEQDGFGIKPHALEAARVGFFALDARVDRELAEIVARLDAAAAEGSRRAALIAAVVVARNGAFVEGLTRLETILSRQADEPDAAAMRALVLARLAETEAARRDAALRALEALAPQDFRDYLARAVGLAALGALPALLAHLDTPCPGPGLDAHARIASAVVAHRLGDEAGARARAEAFVKAQPAIARTFTRSPPSPLAQPLLHRLHTFDDWVALHAAVTSNG